MQGFVPNNMSFANLQTYSPTAGTGTKTNNGHADQTKEPDRLPDLKANHAPEQHQHAKDDIGGTALVKTVDTELYFKIEGHGKDDIGSYAPIQIFNTLPLLPKK